MTVDRYPGRGGTSTVKRSVKIAGPKIAGPSGDNAARNRQALKRMTELELLTGMTAAEWKKFHGDQRERVLRRWGLAA